MILYTVNPAFLVYIPKPLPESLTNKADSFFQLFCWPYYGKFYLLSPNWLRAIVSSIWDHDKYTSATWYVSKEDESCMGEAYSHW